MPEDIGHFKVVLEAEVSSKVGEVLEKEFKNSSKRVGKNLEAEIEKTIEGSIRKAKKFEKSFKIPSAGEISGKLTSFVGESIKKLIISRLAKTAAKDTTTTTSLKTITDKVTDNIPIKSSTKKDDILNKLDKILSKEEGIIDKLDKILYRVVAGKELSIVGNEKSTDSIIDKPLAASEVVPEGVSEVVPEGDSTKPEGSADGMMAFAGKLGAIIGILMLVYNVIKMTTPILAILKMMTSILQLTLYPIAQLLLTIFKPILAMLLKYFILPFYYDVMPILKKFGEWLGGMLGGVVELGGALIEGAKTFIEVEILKIKSLIETLSWVWDTIKIGWDRLCTWFATAWDDFWTGIGDTIDGFTSWLTTGISDTWDGIGTKLSEIWTGISEDVTTTLSPLKDTVSKLFTGIYTSITDTFNTIFRWLRTNIPLVSIALDKMGITAGTSAGGGGGDITTVPGGRLLQIVSVGNGRYNAILDGKPFTSNSTWDMMAKLLQQAGVTNNALMEAAQSGQPVAFANGGIVTQPTIGLLGEAGAEAVIPLNKMSGLSSKPNITINIAKIEKDVDVDALIKRIERELYINMKRGGSR